MAETLLQVGFEFALGAVLIFLPLYVYVHNPSNRRTQEKYMIIFQIQYIRRHKKCRDSAYRVPHSDNSGLESEYM